MSSKFENWRKNLIRKAKTIQNQALHLPSDEYQMMLEERYDKSSTADLSLDELKDLCTFLDELSGKTPQPKNQKSGKGDPQAQKIWRLWQELHGAGEVRDPSEKALNAFVKRQTKVESYKWLNRYQASSVIEALKKWQKRARTA